MKLLKLASISKKLCMGALGAFLLVFLPFHMGMNLCILREDGGEWYRNVCHFMGTNYIVKVFEVILLACVLFHIVMGILLTIENYKSRPVRYAVSNKTKTHTGSKYMIWTGGVIIVFLLIHFVDFYFAKMNLVEGKYVAKIEKYNYYLEQKRMDIMNVCAKEQREPNEKEVGRYNEIWVTFNQMAAQHMDKKGKYMTNLTLEDVVSLSYNYNEDSIKKANPELLGKNGEGLAQLKKDFISKAEFKEYEPDFYNMAREKFANKLYCLIYLLVFVILGIHLYHGVGSVFQTYGLNVKKYAKAIEILAIVYAIIIPLGFALVPLCIIL